jgi:hypothetical protein
MRLYTSNYALRWKSENEGPLQCSELVAAPDGAVVHIAIVVLVGEFAREKCV